MYKKILVPLDGSKLAECALPHAEELAKGCDTTEIILVSVTESVQGYQAVEGSTEPFVLSGGGFGSAVQPPPQRMVPAAFGKKEKQADKYLSRVAPRNCNLKESRYTRRCSSGLLLKRLLPTQSRMALILLSCPATGALA